MPPLEEADLRPSDQLQEVDAETSVDKILHKKTSRSDASLDAEIQRLPPAVTGADSHRENR